MQKRKIAIATAILASASLIVTAHASPKFGASTYSLASEADTSTDWTDSKFIDWVMSRLAIAADFRFQTGAKDNKTPSNTHYPSTAEKCQEQEQQQSSASAEPDATIRNSPTGPEPLYLAF